jgi:hypothetical protein
MTKTSTVKIKNIGSDIDLTNAFAALTNDLDITNEDKVVLYVYWTLESVSAVLTVKVETRAHISTRDADIPVIASSYCPITDQTLSGADMLITPYAFRLTNLDSSGTSAATTEIVSDSIALPVADGRMRVSAKTDSATSGGTLTIVAQKSHLV